jgi:hypothetical protein
VYSLAAGYDYGNLKPLGLPELTLPEMMVISKSITFAESVKLTVPKGCNQVVAQKALRHHVITLNHDAAKAMADMLPRTNLQGVYGLMFIGNKTMWKRALDEDKVPHQVWKTRAEPVYMHFKAFEGLKHPLYKDYLTNYPRTEANTNLLNGLGYRILEDCIVTDDETTMKLERKFGSDVAKNRPHVELDEDSAEDMAGLDQVNEAVYLTTPPNILEHPIADVLDSFARATLPDYTSEKGRADLPTVKAHFADPVNEFTENDMLFSGAYPTLFCTGKGLPYKGSVPKKYARHLMYFHDGRFAKILILCLLFLIKCNVTPCADKWLRKLDQTPKVLKSLVKWLIIPNLNKPC